MHQRNLHQRKQKKRRNSCRSYPCPHEPPQSLVYPRPRGFILPRRARAHVRKRTAVLKMAAAIEPGATTFQTDNSGGFIVAVQQQQLNRFELVPLHTGADATGQLWPSTPSWQGFHHAPSQSQFQAAPSAFPWVPVAPGWFPPFPTPVFFVPRHYLPPPAQTQWCVPRFPNAVEVPNFFVPRLVPAPAIPNAVLPNFFPPRPPWPNMATAIPDSASPTSLVLEPLLARTGTIPNVPPPVTFLVPRSPLAGTATTLDVNRNAFGVPAPWFTQPPMPDGLVGRYGTGTAKSPLPSAYEVQRVLGAPLFATRTRRKAQPQKPASETPPRPHLQQR